MKKVLLILLALTMCVSMCACGSDDSTNNKNTNGANSVSKNDESITLTLDNYEQYLNIVNVFCDTEDQRIYATINIKARSTNFNYNNVKVEINFKGSYKASLTEYDAQLGGVKILDSYTDNYNCNHTVTLDIAGNYFNEYDIVTLKQDYTSQSKDITDFDYTIVGISGTVTPA